MGYVKPKKARKRLEARQREYDDWVSKNSSRVKECTRPGSLRK